MLKGPECRGDLEHSFATFLGINIEINADVSHLPNLQQTMPLYIVEIGNGDDDGTMMVMATTTQRSTTSK